MKQYLSIIVALTCLNNTYIRNMETQPGNLVITTINAVPKDNNGDEIQPNTELGIIYTALKKYTGALQMLQFAKPGLTPTATHSIRDLRGRGGIKIANNEALITNSENQTYKLSLPDLIALNKNYMLFKKGHLPEFKIKRVELADGLTQFTS